MIIKFKVKIYSGIFSSIEEEFDNYTLHLDKRLKKFYFNISMILAKIIKNLIYKKKIK
jgi:hypothetical protein